MGQRLARQLAKKDSLGTDSCLATQWRLAATVANRMGYSMTKSPTLPPTANTVFSAATRLIQTRKGSREAYRRMVEKRGWRGVIDADLREFVESSTSVFLATASADGQPYIQHRGGPPGFLRVLDENTLAFVDFAGNRQYISQGNLSENPKAYLFLIDYAKQRRIKVWGSARVVENDTVLIDQLMPAGYEARPEQVVLFDVTAWDENCPQHIPQRFEAADVQVALAERDARIRTLEALLAQAKVALPS